MQGGARMILNTDQHPGVLKDAVCSPGGKILIRHKLDEKCRPIEV